MGLLVVSVGLLALFRVPLFTMMVRFQENRSLRDAGTVHPPSSEFDMSAALLERAQEQPAPFLDPSTFKDAPRTDDAWTLSRHLEGRLANGRFDEALATIDRMEGATGRWLVRDMGRVIRSFGPNNYLFEHPDRLDRLRGLVLLRRAESANCSPGTGDVLCIFPADRFHETGDLILAIDAFQRGLARFPDDPSVTWLLNLAHLLAGTYPEGVPDVHLLPLDRFQDTSASVPLFRDVASTLGVDERTFYGGSCIDDLDGDGRMELIATSGDLRHPITWFSFADPVERDSAARHFMGGSTGGVHLVQADVNNDGLLDLYVLRGGWLGSKGTGHPNSLLMNLGDGEFEDRTAEMGLLSFAPSHTATWIDVDQDGWVDLFVGNEGSPSHLFINRAGQGFDEVSRSVGIELDELVKGSVLGDFDGDGRPDLYVSCFGSANRLYLNRTEDGVVRFEEAAAAAGVDGPVHSFGCASFDADNDGHMDIFCPTYVMDLTPYAIQFRDGTAPIEASRLYLNTGDGSFRTLDDDDLHRSFLAMGLNVGDIDGDGFEDIYMGTGFPGLEAMVPNILLRNDAGRGLQDVTDRAGVGHLQKGHGISFADVDRDGDLDLHVSMGGFYPSDRFENALFMNTSPGTDQYLRVRLEGRDCNRSAIGARVTLVGFDERGTRREVHRMVGAGGSYGSSPLTLHIGLAGIDTLTGATVRWSADHVEELGPMPMGRELHVVQGAGVVKDRRPGTNGSGSDVWAAPTR